MTVFVVNVLLAATLRASHLDAQAIIQRSVAANRTDYKAAPQYSFTEKDRKDNGTRTYQVTMILGSPYRRLISVDDKPLPEEREWAQRKKMQRELAERRSESPSERAARVAKYEEGRRRDRAMMDQLTLAFDFTLLDEEKIGSRKVYVLQATPKASYHPPTMQTEALTGMQGKLWIDKATFQWVKVEAEVVHPVSIGGFLAEVDKGTRFELEKAPVGNGVWLPSHFEMHSHATVFHIFGVNDQDNETFFDYHKGE